MRREGLPVQKLVGSDILENTAVAMNYQNLDGLYAAIGENHVSRSRRSLSASLASCARARRRPRIACPSRSASAPEQAHRQHGHPRRGARRRHGAALAVLHAGARRRDHRLRHARPGCLGAPGRLRERVVVVDGAERSASSTSSGTARPTRSSWLRSRCKALDRSRLLRDVSSALSDHHVNIIACSTQTGNDRISRMRFEFELADPQHLDSVLSTIRQIDSVYDAYRILPGKGR